ncbi:GAF domain-containing protein [Amycolatopsis sp. NPDC088138]|uniref:GAF domain-containing protein n=1 Tax=Amycolatopsis sp. NPDC088138 TaxID=3363938 RepID=UPI00382DD30D
MSWAGESQEESRTEPERPAFSSLPRRDLDELLDQLVEQVQDVMGLDGRSRGLLRVSRMVAGDLALPTVLRRVVEAARDLLGARYAALGVLGPDNRLAEFVHVGMDAETVARVGRPPEGAGLFGAVAADSRPIRLANITDDPRSSGFPDAYPPMCSFLGVPISVRGVVFGNLYLTESRQGEFGAEDEQLAVALAAIAGQAIANARLRETMRKQQEWLAASTAITRELLAARSASPLELIAVHTQDVADADLVTVLRPDGAGLRIEVAVGAGADELQWSHVDVDSTMCGQVFASGAPVAGSRIDRYSGLGAPIPLRTDLDAMLAVPLTGAGRVNGVLTASRKIGRPGFTAEDLELAAGFIDQASMAVELADARVEQQHAELYDERSRVAVELHSHVVQRLYAIGLSLQTTADAIRPEKTAGRVREAIADLGAVVTRIRETAFLLDDLLPHPASAVHDRLREVLFEVCAEWGLTAAIEFVGHADVIVPDKLTDALADALREGLRLIARHTGAAAVRLEIQPCEDQLSVLLGHDGSAELTMLPDTELAEFAEPLLRRGGTSEVGETALNWWMPLRSRWGC